MTDGTLPAPAPIFIERYDRGRQVSVDVIDGLSEAETVRGNFEIVARAPNGAVAEGAVELLGAEPPAVLYSKVVSLFSNGHDKGPDRPMELWLDRGSGDGRTRSFAGTSVAAWSSDVCLGREEWSLTPRDWGGVKALSVTTSRTAIDHVMVWSEEAPPLVVRWPKHGTFVLACSATSSGSLLRPVLLCDDTLVTAYWAFLRSNLVQAADIVGKRLYASVLKGDDGGRSLVAASHWAYQSGASSEDLEPLLGKLSAMPKDDMDAAVMRWLLSMSLEQGTSVHVFAALLLGLRSTEPLLTETFRLLVKQLTVALRLYEPVDRLQELREGVGWAKRIASSTYWDTELTSYRGARPGHPDPFALTADVPSAAKKKSAEVRFG